MLLLLNSFDFSLSAMQPSTPITRPSASTASLTAPPQPPPPPPPPAAAAAAADSAAAAGRSLVFARMARDLSCGGEEQEDVCGGEEQEDVCFERWGKWRGGGVIGGADR